MNFEFSNKVIELQNKLTNFMMKTFTKTKKFLKIN